MAGIIFAKNSGLNDEAYKVQDAVIKEWMADYDTEKNDYDAYVNAVFNVEKSNQFGEKLGSFTEFGDFEAVPEGGNAIQDDIQVGNTKLITHDQFLKKFTVTSEMIEDKKISDMKTGAEGFVRAYKRSRAAEGSKLLTEATATSVIWGGIAHNTACNDGKALFATDHPGVKSGVATQSNVFTNAIGTDDSMLYRLANIGKNFKNSSGQPMGYEFDTIILPSDAYEAIRLVEKIVGSTNQVGNDYNDINVSKGKFKLIVDPLWVSAGLAKTPYILMSSRANKELRGNMFYDRIPLTVESDKDKNTWNLNYYGRYRVGVGFNAWQHIILGGAAVGTSL